MKTIRYAIPTAEGRLTAHFGHCSSFAIINATEDGTIENREDIVPPPHEPGVLPRWLAEKGVHTILAGGMGMRAIELFRQNGIQVVCGSPSLTPEELVSQHLNGTLQTGSNACDH